MEYQNATEVRRDLSSVLDKAVFDRPQFIRRTKDHILFIGETMMEMALANNNVHVRVQQGDDGKYIATLDEIEDLIATGDSDDAVVSDMAAAILEYAKEYYNEFGLYSRAPNRKNHFPYVLRALALGTPEKVREMLVCHDGKN